jgi:N utilization substance protein B
MAMQVMFLWDVAGDMDRAQAEQALREAAGDAASRDRAIEMATAAWTSRGDNDQWLERLAPQWPPRRQPGVDRSILRLAAWEITSGQTPPVVVIDEAVELAKEFSTEQSPSFVNGVLDALLHEVQNLTGVAIATGHATEAQVTTVETTPASAPSSPDGALTPTPPNAM